MTRAQATGHRTGNAPKRLSLSEIVELLLARGGGEHSSVTLSRNAKGETQIEVTVRTGDTGEITTATQASHEAQTIYDQLRSKYVMGNGTTGAVAS